MSEPGWRRFVISAVQQGLPVPAMSASLAYYDTLRSAVLPSAQVVQVEYLFSKRAPDTHHEVESMILSFVYLTERSTNDLQAQRDCFGGHGFKRLDTPGTFHAIWIPEEKL